MIDVLVVGAGPVGLATAIEARMAGLSAMVVEHRAAHPIDKACGEGLMPGALPLLERLGVDPAGMPITGISYRSGARVADHDFRHGQGRGVRRTALQSALMQRAAALGIEVVRARVDELDQSATSVRAAGVQARWLIGADGLHSSVRRLAGLEGRARSRRRFGLRRHWAIAPWSTRIEVHWSANVEIYVTPVAVDLVGIAMLGPAHVDFMTELRALPELHARVADAVPASTVSGAGPLRQVATAARSGRVLLVGDAAGYVDAITGEGLRLGFAHARAAVDAITGGPAYERAWRRVSRDSRALTSGLVGLAGSPVRGLIVPAAHALPAVYGSIVERLAR